MRCLALAFALLWTTAAWPQSAPTSGPPVGQALGYNPTPIPCVAGQPCWAQGDAYGRALTGGLTYQILTNASATGPVVPNVAGGTYIFNCQGNFAGGGTVTLSALSADGVTYQSVVPLTANGSVGVVLGNNASVKAVITGTVAGMSCNLS